MKTGYFGAFLAQGTVKYMALGKKSPGALPGGLVL